MKKQTNIMLLLFSLFVFASCSKEKVNDKIEEPNIDSEKLKDLSPPPKTFFTDIGNGVILQMSLIPSGRFMMGSNKNPVDPFSNVKVYQPPEDECPKHEVFITKPFYMGTFEITQEQWYEIMGYNHSQYKGRYLPVTGCYPSSINDFCKKLNEKTKDKYRLPTEAEWEYACRAGAITVYSFGNTITEKNANIDNNNVKPVGSYKPNSFNLYDMHGNASEYCIKLFDQYPIGPVFVNPNHSPVEENWIIRGGGNQSKSGRTVHRSACRNAYSGSIGFRLMKPI